MILQQWNAGTAKLCGNTEPSVCHCASFKRIRPGSAFHLPTDALNPPLSFRGAGLSLGWPACSDNCCLWICHCQNSRSTATEEQWTAEPAWPLGNIPLLPFAGWKKDLRVSQLHWKVSFQPAFAFLLASLLLGRCYLMPNINRLWNSKPKNFKQSQQR